jgi:hypothetical protein
MHHRHWLAAVALLAAAASAHATHFEYRIDLSGTYTEGSIDGCTPPDFEGCPKPGTLTGVLSFDTPSAEDGTYMIDGAFGDITNFYVSLGGLPYDVLYGGVDLYGGVPGGVVQSLDQTEYFFFNWADRSAVYSYDYGYHNGNGSFTGTLSTIPEPGTGLLMLAGLAALAGRRARRSVA